jgi:hypothetical protein
MPTVSALPHRCRIPDLHIHAGRSQRGRPAFLAMRAGSGPRDRIAD